MKKLVLYSDQMIDENRKIDRELLRMIGKERPRIAYIASASDITRKYYQPKAEYYRKLGVGHLFYFDLDQEYDESKIDELLSCDAIHLSGGNTYYFLRSLQKRNFIPLLRDYVSRGKVLIGISAGSILMSETIGIARFGDVNAIGLKDLRALNLIDFDFMPHWDKEAASLAEVRDYSKICRTTVYACPDGGGIIIEDDRARIFEILSKSSMGLKRLPDECDRAAERSGVLKPFC